MEFSLSTNLLAPAIALIAWSMLMWLWMYVTRLPAMKAAKMTPNPQAPRGEQMNTLPASVRWKADNYNHLMEQPTLFYPLVIILALLGQGDTVNVALAWSYVGIRVVHSLLQAMVNKIEVRFVLFVLSSLALIALIVNAARVVFAG